MEADYRKRNPYDKTGTSYIEGNTVRQLNAVPDWRREEEQYEVPSPRRHERKAPKAQSGINMASLFVLSIAIAITLYFCVDYLKLQYDINRMEKDILTKEDILTTMINENNAAYEEVNTTYDLDYVYRVAVEELGMVYPNNNTVITYQSDVEDYVRQYADIPE